MLQAGTYYLAYSPTLKMEAACTSEVAVKFYGLPVVTYPDKKKKKKKKKKKSTLNHEVMSPACLRRMSHNI
jgi:hypothetical protein